MATPRGGQLVDPAPLLELAQHHTGTNTEAADFLGVSRRAVQRWHRGSRASVFIADRICIRLGRHIGEFWAPDGTARADGHPTASKRAALPNASRPAPGKQP